MTCGVKTILGLHLALNIAVISLTTLNMIGELEQFKIASYAAEMTLLAYCLAGVPLIVMAFSGVAHRNEVQIRLYHYYLLLTMLFVIIAVVKNVVFTATCGSMPSIFKHSGEAWACGMARWFNLLILVMSLSIIGYFQHVIYSHVEDLAECGGGPELSDLVLNKEAYLKRYRPNTAYCSIEGLANLNQAGWLAQQVLGGDKNLGGFESGPTLFGKNYHETDYPPNTASSAGMQDPYSDKI
jgi:hypothetical protein